MADSLAMNGRRIDADSDDMCRVGPGLPTKLHPYPKVQCHLLCGHAQMPPMLSVWLGAVGARMQVCLLLRRGGKA